MARSAACALLGLVLMAGCGGDGPDRAASPTSPTSTAPPRSTTTLDRAAEEQAVIDAYLRQLDAFYAAANPPNPDHPALAETSTGPLLEGVRSNLADLAARGVATRKGEQTTNNPLVVRLTGNVAVIEDCGVDADVQYDLETGAVVDDSVLTGKSVAKLVKVGETWLTAEITFTEQPCE